MGALPRLVEQDFGYKHSGLWGRSLKHSSLVIDEQKDLWYWNSKGLYGGVREYLTLIRGFTVSEAVEFEKTLNIARFNQQEKLTSTPYEKLVEFLWLNGLDERTYWYRRCLTDSTIDRFRLGYYEGWSTLPIYFEGSLVNIQCRTEEPVKKMKAWYKGTNPVLVNADILQIVTSIIITEGPVDAILLAQLGIPAVSHNGGANYWSSDWFKKFIRIKNIIYIADNDDAGAIGAKNVAKALGEYKVKIYRFKDKPEHYDTVDFFKDGGTKEEYLERIKEATYLFQGGADG